VTVSVPLPSTDRFSSVPPVTRAVSTAAPLAVPLIAPAILSGLLLSFALSVDDFVVTYFNAGSSVTFPIFVWGAARVALPAQINVIGTAIFVVAVAGMLANILFQNIRNRKGVVAV